MKTSSKIKATKKIVASFNKQLFKLIVNMKQKLKKIWLAFVSANAIIFGSCGTVVKATVQQPSDTAKTTITISTNTPVETKVDPNTNVELNTSK